MTGDSKSLYTCTDLYRLDPRAAGHFPQSKSSAGVRRDAGDGGGVALRVRWFGGAATGVRAARVRRGARHAALAGTRRTVSLDTS